MFQNPLTRDYCSDSIILIKDLRQQQIDTYNHQGGVTSFRVRRKQRAKKVLHVTISYTNLPRLQLGNSDWIVHTCAVDVVFPTELFKSALKN